MSDATNAVKALKAARAKDLKTRPVRLSENGRHLSTTKTKAQRDLQNAERINRNAPMVTWRIGEAEPVSLFEDFWKLPTGYKRKEE